VVGFRIVFDYDIYDFRDQLLLFQVVEDRYYEEDVIFYGLVLRKTAQPGIYSRAGAARNISNSWIAHRSQIKKFRFCKLC
jgi:hypothetical protein